MPSKISSEDQALAGEIDATVREFTGHSGALPDFSALIAAHTEKRLKMVEAENARLREQGADSSGAFNTLQNCADTLRTRGFGAEAGAVDERLIAIAQDRDSLQTEAAGLRTKLSDCEKRELFLNKSAYDLYFDYDRTEVTLHLWSEHRDGPELRFYGETATKAIDHAIAKAPTKAILGSLVKRWRAQEQKLQEEADKWKGAADYTQTAALL